MTSRIRLRLRGLALLVSGLAVFGPTTITLVRALASTSPETWEDVFYRPFYATVLRSIKVLGTSAAISTLLGVVVGVCLIRSGHFVRLVSMVFLALPLFLPPFLWAIGFQRLIPLLPYSQHRWLDGFWGSVWATTTFSFPVAAWLTFFAASTIPSATRDSTLLAGGDGLWFRLQLRRAIPAAIGGGLLGSLIALFDPGVGNITGYLTVSGDILIAFASRHDLGLAMAKSLATMALLSPALIAASWLLVRSFGVPELASAAPEPPERRQGVLGATLTLFLSSSFLLTAGYGLVRPLMNPPVEQFLVEAKHLLEDGLPTTITYALAGGATATGLGFLLAILFPPSSKISRGLAAVLILSVAMPPALHALGVVWLRVAAPTWPVFTDSSALVGVVLGLRLVPLGFLIGLRLVGSYPASMLESTELHGVPRFKKLLLHLRHSWQTGCCAVLLLGLIALSDMASVVLLQIPGQSSYGSLLFARMDNSSERLVSAMCLFYCIPALLVLTALSLTWITRKIATAIERTRTHHSVKAALETVR